MAKLPPPQQRGTIPNPMSNNNILSSKSSLSKQQNNTIVPIASPRNVAAAAIDLGKNNTRTEVPLIVTPQQRTSDSQIHFNPIPGCNKLPQERRVETVKRRKMVPPGKTVLQIPKIRVFKFSNLPKPGQPDPDFLKFDNQRPGEVSIVCHGVPRSTDVVLLSSSMSEQIMALYKKKKGQQQHGNEAQSCAIKLMGMINDLPGTKAHLERCRKFLPKYVETTCSSEKNAIVQAVMDEAARSGAQYWTPLNYGSINQKKATSIEPVVYELQDRETVRVQIRQSFLMQYCTRRFLNVCKSQQRCPQKVLAKLQEEDAATNHKSPVLQGHREDLSFPRVGTTKKGISANGQATRRASLPASALKKRKHGANGSEKESKKRRRSSAPHSRKPQDKSNEKKTARTKKRVLEARSQKHEDIFDLVVVRSSCNRAVLGSPVSFGELISNNNGKNTPNLAFSSNRNRGLDHNSSSSADDDACAYPGSEECLVYVGDQHEDTSGDSVVIDLDDTDGGNCGGARSGKKPKTTGALDVIDVQPATSTRPTRTDYDGSSIEGHAVPQTKDDDHVDVCNNTPKQETTRKAAEAKPDHVDVYNIPKQETTLKTAETRPDHVDVCNIPKQDITHKAAETNPPQDSISLQDYHVVTRHCLPGRGCPHCYPPATQPLICFQLAPNNPGPEIFRPPQNCSSSVKRRQNMSWLRR